MGETWGQPSSETTPHPRALFQGQSQAGGESGQPLDQESGAGGEQLDSGGREETGPRQREKPGGSTAYGDLGVQRETGAGAGHSGQVRTHFSSCEALRKSSWRVLSMAGGWSGGWHETVVCVKAPWPGEQLPGSWVLSAPGCALGGGKCFWFPPVISSEWGPRGGWRPLPSSSPPCSCRISPALSLCTAGLRT